MSMKWVLAKFARLCHRHQWQEIDHYVTLAYGGLIAKHLLLHHGTFQDATCKFLVRHCGTCEQYQYFSHRRWIECRKAHFAIKGRFRSMLAVDTDPWYKEDWHYQAELDKYSNPIFLGSEYPE